MRLNSEWILFHLFIYFKLKLSHNHTQSSSTPRKKDDTKERKKYHLAWMHNTRTQSSYYIFIECSAPLKLLLLTTCNPLLFYIYGTQDTCIERVTNSSVYIYFSNFTIDTFLFCCMFQFLFLSASVCCRCCCWCQFMSFIISYKNIRKIHTHTDILSWLWWLFFSSFNHQ